MFSDAGPVALLSSDCWLVGVVLHVDDQDSQWDAIEGFFVCPSLGRLLKEKQVSRPWDWAAAGRQVKGIL